MGSPVRSHWPSVEVEMPCGGGFCPLQLPLLPSCLIFPWHSEGASVPNCANLSLQQLRVRALLGTSPISWSPPLAASIWQIPLFPESQDNLQMQSDWSVSIRWGSPRDTELLSSSFSQGMSSESSLSAPELPYPSPADNGTVGSPLFTPREVIVHCSPTS